MVRLGLLECIEYRGSVPIEGLLPPLLVEGYGGEVGFTGHLFLCVDVEGRSLAGILQSIFQLEKCIFLISNLKNYGEKNKITIIT